MPTQDSVASQQELIVASEFFSAILLTQTTCCQLWCATTDNTRLMALFWDYLAEPVPER